MKAKSFEEHVWRSIPEDYRDQGGAGGEGKKMEGRVELEISTL